jgi:hypothetical protein
MFIVFDCNYLANRLFNPPLLLHTDKHIQTQKVDKIFMLIPQILPILYDTKYWSWHLLPRDFLKFDRKYIIRKTISCNRKKIEWESTYMSIIHKNGILVWSNSWWVSVLQTLSNCQLWMSEKCHLWHFKCDKKVTSFEHQCDIKLAFVSMSGSCNLSLGKYHRHSLKDTHANI